MSCRSGRSRSWSTTPTLPNGSPPHSGSTPLVWPYLTSADRSRRRPGRGTLASIRTLHHFRRRSPGARSWPERGAWSLVWLAVVTGGVNLWGFWWWSPAVVALAPLMIIGGLVGVASTWLVGNPRSTSLPAGHSRSGDRDCTVSAVDRDQYARRSIPPTPRHSTRWRRVRWCTAPIRTWPRCRASLVFWTFHPASGPTPSMVVTSPTSPTPLGRSCSAFRPRRSACTWPSTGLTSSPGSPRSCSCSRCSPHHCGGSRRCSA